MAKKISSKLGALGLGLALSTSALSAAESQKLTKFEDMKSFKGDAKIFSGEVKVTLMFGTNENRNVSGGLVEFSPKARSAWHTHPAGQTLIIVEGEIYTGTENGITQIAKKGDVIECPVGVKHWHGAGATQKGVHIALTGVKDGQNVTWLEKLSDEEYEKAIKNAK
ncbi:cupin domain-containing protein [Campylobacter sp. MIT 12-5580]|nr:cupin domain-containing protein [Campylobacter sp. MIT 12-5580]